MGGNLSCFGSAGGYHRDADEPAYEQLRPPSKKVRPSDEDRLWYIGERDVDRKADEFIAKFHASTRFVEAN
ncbi:hypothetical protein ABZP36_021514 [Zizania latifolia]